jgi:alkanesulfonate monooxygenase SsuD/methylene tetrahydromethanopterin reductase-like flavin-dependent oxidoreductase (luciferase family)
MAQGRPDLTKIIDLAEQAEASGFDSVWVGNSILARPRLEALTTLAAVAAGAQTVVLRFGGPDQFGQLEWCTKEVLPRVT